MSSLCQVVDIVDVVDTTVIPPTQLPTVVAVAAIVAPTYDGPVLLLLLLLSLFYTLVMRTSRSRRRRRHAVLPLSSSLYW